MLIKLDFKRLKKVSEQILMNLSLSLVKTTYLEGKEAKNTKIFSFFVFCRMFIFISQDSDESAIASSLNTRKTEILIYP